MMIGVLWSLGLVGLAGVVSADDLVASPERPDGKVSELRLADVFSDGMVMQRNQDVRVWGWGTPGVTVTVTFAGQKKTDAVGKDGTWMVKLAPMKASATPAEMMVIQSDAEKAVVRNVLVGEVWFCSGQSNMAWKMSQLGELYDKEVAQATYPNLRVCSIPKDMFATTPQKRVEMSWQTCNPESVKSFSAVAFFFGAKLLKELKVPIGLVESPRGGSSIVAWISDTVLREEFPGFTEKLDTYRSITDKTGGVFDHRRKSKVHGITQRAPAVLYNARVHPFVPYSIRGAIWYQGETDVSKPDQYRKLFPAMIRQWRADWNQGDFPFYYVQIAPCGYKGVSAAYLREAQMMALSVPHTGMAVIMDLGDEKNIHPLVKKPVGERLARIALAKDYGRNDLVYSGPVVKQSSVEKNSIRLGFNHLGGGLVSRDGKPLSHFTIAGKDLKFVEAKAVIDGETIVVSSASVPSPVAVRYAWGSADIPNLMNKEGLPASSFRTDQK